MGSSTDAVSVQGCKTLQNSSKTSLKVTIPPSPSPSSQSPSIIPRNKIFKRLFNARKLTPGRGLNSTISGTSFVTQRRRKMLPLVRSRKKRRSASCECCCSPKVILEEGSHVIVAEEETFVGPALRLDPNCKCLEDQSEGNNDNLYRN